MWQLKTFLRLKGDAKVLDHGKETDEEVYVVYTYYVYLCYETQS